MAATDYVVVEGFLNVYLAKKTKGHLMSKDRRVITDNEICGLFEFYLRRWCREHDESTVYISDGENKPLFSATLLDMEEKFDGTAE